MLLKHVLYYAMQHFSDCVGSAIFGISSNKVAIWTNSYQIPMHFDQVRTSSKCWRTWVGVHSLQSLGCFQKLFKHCTFKSLQLMDNILHHPSTSRLRTGLKQLKLHRILIRIGPDWTIDCSRRFRVWMFLWRCLQFVAMLKTVF
jgi:hypothetical protein